MIKLPDDRCITTRAHDDGLFDREYWLDYRDHPIARLGMFNRFLKQFDLIGMPKTQVVNILGEPVQCWLPGTPCLTENGQLLLSRPDLLIYAFPAIGCTPSFFGVKIYFKDDKVERWCFARDSKDSEPVTTNVVLDWSKRTDDGRLLGARIGSGEDFPPFLAKVRKRSKR
jgi:hypothetical protein